MNTHTNDWLLVSTDGFAQQNSARPREHLVKELLQNGLDSLTGLKGRIELAFTAGSAPETLLVTCRDTGCGIDDMETIRTVFWTSKQDSPLKRGRMGRGFKESLCLALHCEVVSKGMVAIFSKSPTGERLFSVEKRDDQTQGTLISMLMPWDAESTIPTLEAYFGTFLPPKDITVTVNGAEIAHKTPNHSISAALTTESFQDGRWIKPSLKTTIELVKADGQGLIYEMGIPVCPVEWDVPYHCNILQRVPQNPNRDAVMSGYCAKLHKACLPTVLKELGSEEVRAAWVGEAAAKIEDPKLQKEVLDKAFGGNLARSVPSFGKFSHDAAAEEIAGAKILDMRQLSGGFRELARIHVPTSKEVEETARRKARQDAADNTIDLSNPHDNSKAIVDKYGKAHIQNVCRFHQWLADKILASLFPDEAKTCTVKTALIASTALATWSHQHSVFTLALDYAPIWTAPLSSDNFALHIHETAHELAAHHGNSFATAMEKTAGLACNIINEHPQEMARWKKTFAKAIHKAEKPPMAIAA